jgi:hypothetical protein
MSTSSRRTRGAPVWYLREVLRRYERQVLPVFKRHGGAFDRIWTTPADVAEPTTDPEAPDEIHLARRAAGSGDAGAGRAARHHRAPGGPGARRGLPLGRYFEDPA